MKEYGNTWGSAALIAWRGGCSVNGASGGGNGAGGIQLDASKSNSIYGKSNTVTPLSRKCLFLIKF